MQFRSVILETLSDIREYQCIWTHLHSHYPSTIYQSYQWVESCIQHIHPNEALFCVLCFDSDNIISIAPFYISSKNNTKILTFIGGALSDYNFLLVNRVYTYDLAYFLTCKVVRKYTGIKYDHILLNHIDVKSQEYAYLSKKLKKEREALVEYEKAMALTLPVSKTLYEKNLPSSSKKKFKYYRRRALENNLFHFELLSIESIDSYIYWFKRHKQNLWVKFNTVLPEEMKKESFFDFLQSIIVTLFLENKVIIPSLKKGDQIVAMGIYFLHNQTMSKYIQAWDYSYKNYNIGTVLDWEMIRYCIDANYCIFDLGRGDEAYKYKFGAQEIKLANFLLGITS